MKTYAQEAENLRLLLWAGIVSIDDVVAWADRTILTLPEYDDDLTEISLGGKLQIGEMDPRLYLVSVGADHLEAIRNLLGRMHQVLLTDRSRARDFARTMRDISGEYESEIPRELNFMDQFEEPDTENTARASFADDLIALTAPFDRATLVPTPPLPASHPSQLVSSPKRGTSIRERLRRFFRGGRK